MHLNTNQYLDLGIMNDLLLSPDGGFKFEVQRVDDDAEKSQSSQV